MSSLSAHTELIYATQQINIYCGLFILISGVIGQLFNIIIFTSLKTFRSTSCAFYLTINSIVNAGELLTSLLVRILSEGFLIDPTGIAWFCKLRIYWALFFTLLSLTSLCLAAIDQFLSVTKFRHWSNLRLAQRHMIFASILWCGYCVSALVLWQSNHGICTIVNSIYGTYIRYFHFPVLSGCLPLTIMIVFSLLAFFNFRTTASQQMNIIRLSQDRQLSAMTLVQVIVIVITTLPWTISYIYALRWSSTNPDDIAYDAFISTITALVFYGGYASPFYIYCFVSKRFRKQLIYVLIRIHLNNWRRRINKMHENRVTSIRKIPKNDDEHERKVDKSIALYQI